MADMYVGRDSTWPMGEASPILRIMLPIIANKINPITTMDRKTPEAG